MYELIYYTIPGLLFIVSSYFLYGFSLPSDQAIVLAATSPVLGFIFHQTYRILFERTGGHYRKSRKVIERIIQIYGGGKKTISQKEAFLIWEMSIYHHKSSSEFLNHDARMWRFTISFWALAMTAIVDVILFLIISRIVNHSFAFTSLQLIILAILILIAFLFVVAGRQVLSLLNDQEIAYVYIYKDLFDDNAEAILKAKI